MRKCLFLAGCTVLVFSVACKNSYKETEKENSELFKEMAARDSLASFNSADSTVLKAYKDDKTTVSALDVAPGDTTYSLRTKVLYVNDKTEKLAAVYGMKSDGSLGVVIVQKEGGNPVTLKQTEIKGVINGVYTDGKTTFRRNDKQVSLTIDGVTTMYRKIE